MIDSSNALLLKPARDGAGFVIDRARRSPVGSTTSPATLVVAVICPFAKPPDSTFVDVFDRRVRPAFEKAGGRTLGYFVTDSSPNNFPALPLREGEQIFIWFTAFATEGQAAAHLASDEWGAISRELSPRLSGAPEILRLSPTSRSALGQ
jgi:hypothetical protein